MKSRSVFNLFSLFALLAALIGGAAFPTAAYAASVLYVKPAGAGNCTSWANACSLQTALSNAVSGDSIWVQAGTHTPHASDRYESFRLKSGVAVYGGFLGTETLLSQRNPIANTTILSGDIGIFGDMSDNSYSVVWGGGSEMLDGFTIAYGNANGGGVYNQGGGMSSHGGSPTLSNLIFLDNVAVLGGGMFNTNNSPILTNVTFSENSASGGGGMYNWNSNPSLTNVTFSENYAPYGGGMYNDKGSPILTNVTFSSGGLFNYQSSSPTLTNVIIANSITGGSGDCVNVSSTLNVTSANNLIEDAAHACGLTHGVNGNIIGLDPILGVLANNGGAMQTHALLAGSPAIDTGNDNACPDTDQRGMARPFGMHCDIGSFEVQPEEIIILSAEAHDGWILESSETSGLGGTKNNTATMLRVGDDAANKQYRALLSFDTSSLPEGAVITSVTLRFKDAGKTGTLPFGATHGNLFADMCEGTFKNNSALQLGDFNARCPVGFYKVKALIYTNSRVDNWYSQSLLPEDFQFINLGGLTQFRLRFARDDNNDFGADFLKFFSGNAAEADCPHLVIEYSVP